MIFDNITLYYTLFLALLLKVKMRIIAGKFKGKKLKEFSGTSVRPTSDRAREALFNILSFDIAGSIFLDLFAGTGAVGIEALSRGAEKVEFVDKDKQIKVCC